MLSWVTRSWKKRKSCPLSYLVHTPTLFQNGYFYVFGRKIDNDVIVSSVLRFEPRIDFWEEVGNFGNPRHGHRVIQSDYGFVVVGGNSTSKEPRLCRFNVADFECFDIEDTDPESKLYWTENVFDVVLFTFNDAQCPENLQGKLE